MSPIYQYVDTPTLLPQNQVFTMRERRRQSFTVTPAKSLIISISLTKQHLCHLTYAPCRELAHKYVPVDAQEPREDGQASVCVTSEGAEREALRARHKFAVRRNRHEHTHAHTNTHGCTITCPTSPLTSKAHLPLDISSSIRSLTSTWILPGYWERRGEDGPHLLQLDTFHGNRIHTASQ